jgi:hypothetical protein
MPYAGSAAEPRCAECARRGGPGRIGEECESETTTMRTFITKHRYGILASIVVAAAFLLRAHGARWGLPMVLEEATPMRQASEIWGAISSGRIDLNPHFFNYPSLTIYIQVILQGIAHAWQRLFGAGFDLGTVLLLQRIDPTENALIGRMTSIAFSAATVAVLYLLVKRVAGGAAGVLAAVLLAVAPYHINESRFIQTDPVLGFLTACAVLLALRLAERGTVRDYVFFGGALGLAAAAKYPGLFAIVCLVPAHCCVVLREGRSWRSALLDKRILAFLGAVVVMFFVASPYCLLDFHSFWKDFSFERDHMQAGHFGQVGGTGIALPYYIRNVLLKDFGAPLTVLFFVGMLAGFLPGLGPWRRAIGTDREAPARERNARIDAVILSLFSLFFIAVVGAWTMRAERYLMPLAPFVAGIPVVLIIRLTEPLGRRGAVRGAAVAAVFVAVALQPAVKGIEAAAVTQDSRELARSWILANAPENGMIAKESLTPDFWRQSDYVTVERRIEAMTGRARERGRAILSGIRYYQVVEIPLYVLYPEGSAPYYDIRLFADVDYVVTSSLVTSRYTADTSRFPAQNEFYDELDRYWERAASFEAGGRVAGPEIVVYRRTGATDSLIAAARGTLEDAWYARWKVNPDELHRFVKPLAKRALAAGDYALADVLFKAGDRSDPEVRYGLAAMAAVEERYGEMVDHIEWLISNYLLTAATGPGATARARGAAGAGQAPESDSVRELRLRLLEIIDYALRAPNFPDALRSKVAALRATCKPA